MFVNAVGSPQSQQQNSPAAADHYIHSTSDASPRSDQLAYSPRDHSIGLPLSPRDYTHHVTSSMGGSSLGSALSEVDTTDDEIAVRFGVDF